MIPLISRRRLLSLSAHKRYGPKGIGALFVSTGTVLDPLLHGGSQEHGRRGGTVTIAWGCLALDHLTRHHFSRRLQALSLLVWTVLGVCTIWLLARLISGD